MIEIQAKLARAIYATGERVECVIEFMNTKPEGSSESDPSESLAWASAQLHCYRKTSYKNQTQDKVAELSDLVSKTALDAVTQAPGEVVVATKPKILFCDLNLQPGETKIYLFNESLPRDGPPTYRGHDIKYFYKITVATQRVMSKVQTLTIPIRVLPVPITPRPDEIPCTEETNAELAPTNPFLEKRELSELEISWHHIKNLTACRAPKFYRISNKRGYVGKFCLFKPHYKLGEDIVGSLDFTDCKVRCVQFSVKLQSQEFQLTPTANPQSSEQNDASSVTSLDLASIASGSANDNVHKSTTSSGADNDGDEATGIISTYATNHEVCYAIVQTQVLVPIPLHVTPSFKTDFVEVKWRLHFEFVTSPWLDFGKPNPPSGQIKAPSEIPVETMVWNLPITLYTANPLQIYSPNQPYNLIIK